VVVAIALISPPTCPLVATSSDKSFHFFFQDGDQCHPDCLPHLLSKQGLKVDLTELLKLGIIISQSHGILHMVF
jgi:hypothetical protein